MNVSFGQGSGRGELGRGGGIVAILFGLFFAVLPLVMGYLVLGSFFEERKTSDWMKIPVTSFTGQVAVDRSADDSFSLSVKYSYDWKGVSYEGDRVWFNEKSYDDFARAREVLNRIKEIESREGGLLCRVNPDDPSEAILLGGTIWAAVGLGAFLSVFVLVGLFSILSGVRTLLGKKKEVKKKFSSGFLSEFSIFGKSLGSFGWILGVLFGGVFLAVGVGVLWGMWWLPKREAKAAESWDKVPCRIIFSELKSHEGDDSTTYSVEVFYAYHVKGERYRSSRYSFVNGSTNINVGEMRKVVRGYNKRKKAMCYVDPKDPWNAVLTRELHASWFGLLFGALFGVAGLVVMVGVVWSQFFKGGAKGAGGKVRDGRGGFGELTGGEGGLMLGAGAGMRAGGHRVLKPTGKRLLAFVGLLVFALIWNGFVWGLMWREMRGSSGDGELGWFFWIFAAAGVAVALGAFYKLLAFFNAAVVVTLENEGCCLGEELEVSWEMSSSRVKRLLVTVQCVEEATYQRGTDSVTDKELCAVLPVVDTTRPLEMQSGRVSLMLPLNLMPTWESDNNEIVWNVLVEGDVPFWPNIKDEYAIEVNR